MEVGGAASSLLLLPLKSRSSAIQMLFGGFFDCIIENRSNAELYLLVPKHRGKKAVNRADLFCGDVGGDVGVGGSDDAADAFGEIEIEIYPLQKGVLRTLIPRWV